MSGYQSTATSYATRVTDAIEVRALEPLDDATLDSLDEEARDLRRLLADREPAAFSRFGRWWDRLPDGPTITIGS